MRMNDDVSGIEEDYVIASEYENCLDDVVYSEEFNEDDVMLVLASTNLIMVKAFFYFYFLSFQNFFGRPSV